MRNLREMNARLERTLHSGHKNRSLHVMEVAVEHFRKINKDKLSQVDQDYVCDLSRKLTITPCAMMLAMVYLERLKVKNPDYMRQLSSSDLFLISTMMSSKYMHDEGIEDDVYNDDWADSVNMNIKELNHLEMDYLQAMDWALFVNGNDFQTALDSMEFEVAKRCAMIRGGWLTYTDLLVLTKQMDLVAWFSEHILLIVSTGMVFYASLLSLLTGYVASAMVTQSSTLIVSTPATNSDLFHQYPQPNLTPAEITHAAQFQSHESDSIDLVHLGEDADMAEESDDYQREFMEFFGIRGIGHRNEWKRSTSMTQEMQSMSNGREPTETELIDTYLPVFSTEIQPSGNLRAQRKDGIMLNHEPSELSVDFPMGDDYENQEFRPEKSILTAENELNHFKLLETLRKIVANGTEVNETETFSHVSQPASYKIYSCHLRYYSQKSQNLCY